MFNTYNLAAALLIIAFLNEYPGFIYHPKECIKLIVELIWLRTQRFWYRVEDTWDRVYCYVVYGFDIKEIIEKHGEEYIGW